MPSLHTSFPTPFPMKKRKHKTLLQDEKEFLKRLDEEEIAKQVSMRKGNERYEESTGM